MDACDLSGGFGPVAQGSARLACLASSVPVPLWRRALRLGPATATVLTALSPTIPVASLKQSRNPSVPKVLLAAEERQVIRSYKIGVLYAKPGQRTEAELLSNQHGACARGDAFAERLTQNLRSVVVA